MVGLLSPRFVRARLQPCRTARKIRAALAAEVRFSSCHTDSLSLDGKSPSELGLQPLEGATGSQRTGEPFNECFSTDGPFGSIRTARSLSYSRCFVRDVVGLSGHGFFTPDCRLRGQPCRNACHIPGLLRIHSPLTCLQRHRHNRPPKSPSRAKNCGKRRRSA